MKFEEALKIEKGIAYEINGHTYINMDKELFLDCIDYAQQFNFGKMKKGFKELDKLLGDEEIEFYSLTNLLPNIVVDFCKIYERVSSNVMSYFSNVNAIRLANEYDDNYYFIRDDRLALSDKNAFEALFNKDKIGLENVVKKSSNNKGLYV
jgi:hypothetical protein